MCCVLLEWEWQERKYKLFLSSSALEVVYKTILQHSEQWKLQQQMTTCWTEYHVGQYVLWAPRPSGTVPRAELVGVAHPRSVQFGSCPCAWSGSGCIAGHTAECLGNLKAEGRNLGGQKPWPGCSRRPLLGLGSVKAAVKHSSSPGEAPTRASGKSVTSASAASGTCIPFTGHFVNLHV